MDGMAGVEARIAQIQSMFATPSVSATAPSDGTSTDGTSTSSSSNFSALLDQAQSSSSTGATSGGPLSATREQWARDFLSRLGMPESSENVRAMVAWQQAEGTKAQYNPLATTQNMPGATKFNSVGVKNFTSYDDGLTANIEAITNGRYANILAALQQGTSATDVAQAIANSPWGTGQGVLRVLQSQNT
jgi:hypothetical protein